MKGLSGLARRIRTHLGRHSEGLTGEAPLSYPSAVVSSFARRGLAMAPSSRTVWVFQGNRPHSLPSAVFSSRELAAKWISKHRLSGTLTQYPIDESVMDWALRTDPGGYTLEELREIRKDPEQLANFSHAAQDHVHFENGIA